MEIDETHDVLYKHRYGLDDETLSKEFNRLKKYSKLNKLNIEQLTPLNERYHEKVDVIHKEFGCYMSVDSTCTPVEKPICGKKRRKLWNTKHASCNYKYECAVGNLTGECYWVSGPHYGSEHDFKIIKKSGGLLSSIHKREIMFGDKGYIGDIRILTPKRKRRNHPDDDELNFYKNNFVSSYRIIVENYFAQLKKWKVLTLPWRSTSKNHKKMFLILVYLTNLKIKKVPLRDEDYFVDETESEEEYENIPCDCDECSDSEGDGDSDSGENEENEDHSE
ncbi:hypothetical protein ACTFIR_011889 [Dictyostelium discoideum]